MQTRGQGATEYLVLLAVVLVIALVGVALLGFFPGTANDAQIAESQIYWQSANPIAIIEASAPKLPGQIYTYPIVRIRNSGPYQIQVTKVFGENSTALRYFDGSNGSDVLVPISSSPVFRLGPGEEVALGRKAEYPALPFSRYLLFTPAACSNDYWICSAQTGCNTSNFVSVRNFGFEYVQYVEGQQITKREVGAKPLIIRCT